MPCMDTCLRTLSAFWTASAQTSFCPRMPTMPLPSQSAVYRLPPHVLREICVHAKQRPPRVPNWPGTAVTCLASSCRLFYQPAIETIWSFIPQFAILLYTLPQDAWVAEETTDWPRPITFVSVSSASICASSFLPESVFGLSRAHRSSEAAHATRYLRGSASPLVQSRADAAAWP